MTKVLIDRDDKVSLGDELEAMRTIAEIMDRIGDDAMIRITTWYVMRLRESVGHNYRRAIQELEVLGDCIMQRETLVGRANEKLATAEDDDGKGTD
jgi:hypothetical protein